MASIKHWKLCLIPVFPTVPQSWSVCEWKAWKVKEGVLLLWLTVYKPLLDVIFLVPCPIKMSLTVWGEGQRRTHCCFFHWLTGYKLFLAFPSLKFLLFVTRSLCNVACLWSCCCCPMLPLSIHSVFISLLVTVAWCDFHSLAEMRRIVQNSCWNPLEWFPLGCNEMLRVQLISILLPKSAV